MAGSQWMWEKIRSVGRLERYVGGRRNRNSLELQSIGASILYKNS